jgi:hypothetical protein
MIQKHITSNFEYILDFIDGDLHYTSINLGERPIQGHRSLFKRLYRYFGGEVPVKLVKDGNTLWVLRRENE